MCIRDSLISSLYSLLNNRLGAKLPTIVTTNITDGALLEKLLSLIHI